jgi:redox-sensitive bicupin YhaK (pirin superfamily)
MDFHSLPERRLILHVRGEVEIGVRDGRTQIFQPGDARLMEDTSGRGYTHRDLSPVIQAVVVLHDWRSAGTPLRQGVYPSAQEAWSESAPAEQTWAGLSLSVSLDHGVQHHHRSVLHQERSAVGESS